MHTLDPLVFQVGSFFILPCIVCFNLFFTGKFAYKIFENVKLTHRFLIFVDFTGGLPQVVVKFAKFFLFLALHSCLGFFFLLLLLACDVVFLDKEDHTLFVALQFLRGGYKSFLALALLLVEC